MRRRKDKLTFSLGNGKEGEKLIEKCAREKGAEKTEAE